jgi:hypothetical protein
MQIRGVREHVGDVLPHFALQEPQYPPNFLQGEATCIYSSADVARIASVSLRQLQWWDERKVVSPRHEGRKRTYLPQDVVEITVIAELRRKGDIRHCRVRARAAFALHADRPVRLRHYAG